MDEELVFTPSEARKLRDISEFYTLGKELILFGEQIDPQGRTLSQAITELRNCLDHLMRVTAAKSGIHKIEDLHIYISANLDKAFAHVYRSVYDTLDWIAVTIRGLINDELQKYSDETIMAVLPDYFRTIRPKMEYILTEEITRLRVEKDVTTANADNLAEYARIVAALKDLHKQIGCAVPSLIEHKMLSKKRERNQLLIRVGEVIFTGIVVGLVVWFSTKPPLSS